MGWASFQFITAVQCSLHRADVEVVYLGAGCAHGEGGVGDIPNSSE